MKRRLGWIAVVLMILLGGAPRVQAAADMYAYGLLIDTDNNPSTGCDVPVSDATTGSTTFLGVERLVTLTVARSGMDGTVTGITVQDCDACVISPCSTPFGPAQPVSTGGWPVGKGDGVGGSDVIEGFVPQALIGNGNLVRVAFTASRAVDPNSDVVLSTTGELDGTPILFHLLFYSPVPLLSTGGLALSVLSLGGVAWWALRRRVRAQRTVFLALLVTGGVAATALALTIVMDGQVGDWGSLPPVAIDATGDSTLHDLAEDLVAGFLTADETNLYFRMDVSGSCAPGYADCNNYPQDGCETDITTTANCGGCGSVCSGQHVVGSSCAAGVCTGTCEPGWADCNADKLTDGCETFGTCS